MIYAKCNDEVYITLNVNPKPDVSEKKQEEILLSFMNEIGFKCETIKLVTKEEYDRETDEECAE